jgi:ribosome maturation factor RimP
MATRERTDALVAAIAPVLSGLGLELVDVELAGSGRARTLRVSIDRPSKPGAVDLDAITSATQALSPVLDTDEAVARALPGPYTLEVSSPGLERPLRTPAQFRWAVGKPVSVKTRATGVVVRRRGTIVAADDAGIDIDIDGSHERLAYDDIIQARTVFEWGAPSAPQPRRKKKNKQQHQQEVAS